MKRCDNIIINTSIEVNRVNNLPNSKSEIIQKSNSEGFSVLVLKLDFDIYSSIAVDY